MRRRQEIFDAAYKGLASQGFVRSLAEVGCAYRGAEGRRCAIGFLIPDEKYSPELEGLTPEDIVVCRAADICEDDWMFAKDLQEAHDGPNGDIEDDTPEEMKARLLSFAKLHNLTIPQVAA